jgi:hypothetical protein
MSEAAEHVASRCKALQGGRPARGCGGRAHSVATARSTSASTGLRLVRSYHGPYGTVQPDALRHRRLRMTGTEQPRGAAGRGPQLFVSGPRRSCTALREAAPPAVGPTGATGRACGPRELRVYACTSRHRRPRDPQGDSGPRAGPEELTRSGPTHPRMRISAPPAAVPEGDRGRERSGCVIRSGHTDVDVAQCLFAFNPHRR